MVSCPKCGDKAALRVLRAAQAAWTVAAVTAEGIVPEAQASIAYASADTLICEACGWVGDLPGYLTLAGQGAAAAEALKAPLVEALDRYVAATADEVIKADLDAVRTKLASSAGPAPVVGEIEGVIDGKVR